MSHKKPLDPIRQLDDLARKFEGDTGRPLKIPTVRKTWITDWDILLWEKLKKLFKGG